LYDLSASCTAFCALNLIFAPSHARLWQCAVAAAVFDRSVRGMAPTLTASIIPLLPVISHFAFDFTLSPDREAPSPCDVPPLTTPFRALLNTQVSRRRTHRIAQTQTLNHCWVLPVSPYCMLHPSDRFLVFEFPAPYRMNPLSFQFSFFMFLPSDFCFWRSVDF
jgi:hypothetical protein